MAWLLKTMSDSARRPDEDAAIRLRTIAEAMKALDAALEESRAFPDIPLPTLPTAEHDESP
jgi:hypothetical protein